MKTWKKPIIAILCLLAIALILFFVFRTSSDWRSETENWEAEYRESGRKLRIRYRGEDRQIRSMDITVQAGLETSRKHEEYDEGEYLHQGKEITVSLNDTKLKFDEINIQIQCEYGKLLWKNALYFPDSKDTVVTVKSYDDNSSSLELDEEEKNTLFDLIKKEAQFKGYSSQNAISPIVQGEGVFSVVITGNEYSSVFYLSEESEKTVLCVDDHYIKTGEMRQTKSFVSKLFE